MSARSHREGSRRGFTLVEVLLAIGLLSILVIALVRLLDTSLRIWGRTEESRDLQEMGAAVLDLFADDVYALEPGPRGDLVADWVRFDTDRDGSPGMVWPRVRLVRQPPPAALRPRSTGASAVASRGEGSARLREVCWALLPADGVDADERSIGVLWRGERVFGDEDTLSLLDERFFDAAEKPLAGSLAAVTGGVLWFEPWFATHTSVLRDGWTLGPELGDCAASWDARDAGRPDPALSWLNEPAAGMPVVDDRPHLPRRVRLTLEVERPADLRHRARLAAGVDRESGRILVDDEARLPEAGGWILVDEEWMRLGPVSRGSAAVERAGRGTRAAAHAAGALVHHGTRLVREVPVGTSREDWDL